MGGLGGVWGAVHEKALKLYICDKNVIISDKSLVLTQMQKTGSLHILKSV